MCLAIPAQVKEIDEGNLATVDILGVTREISLDLTPQAEVGSYVLVHAGFAIEVVDEQFAQETLDLVKSFPILKGSSSWISLRSKIPRLPKGSSTRSIHGHLNRQRSWKYAERTRLPSRATACAI